VIFKLILFRVTSVECSVIRSRLTYIIDQQNVSALSVLYDLWFELSKF